MADTQAEAEAALQSGEADAFLYEVFLHSSAEARPGTAEQLAEGEPLLAEDEALVPVPTPPPTVPLRAMALRVWRTDPGALVRALIDSGTLSEAARSARRWLRAAVELSAHPAPAPLLAARHEASDWLLAVSPDGEAVAIVRHLSLSLHVQSDNFSTAVGLCALPPDRRPSLRLAAWSSDSRALCVCLSDGRFLLFDRDRAGALRQRLRPRRFGPLRGGVASLAVRAVGGGALLLHVLRNDGCVQLVRATLGGSGVLSRSAPRHVGAPAGEAAAAGGGAESEDGDEEEAEDAGPTSLAADAAPSAELSLLAQGRVAPRGGVACCLELLPLLPAFRPAAGGAEAEGGGGGGSFAVGGRAADGAPYIAVWTVGDDGGSALRVLASTVDGADGMTRSAAVRRLSAQRADEASAAGGGGGGGGGASNARQEAERVAAPNGGSGARGGAEGAEGVGLVHVLRAFPCGSRIASLSLDGTIALWSWAEARAGGGGDREGVGSDAHAEGGLTLEAAAPSAALRAHSGGAQAVLPRALAIGLWATEREGAAAALIVGREDGSVSVGALHSIAHDGLAGSLPDRFEPGGIAALSDARAGQFFVLERARTWLGAAPNGSRASAGDGGQGAAGAGADAAGGDAQRLALLAGASASSRGGDSGWAGAATLVGLAEWLFLLLWHAAFTLLGGSVLPLAPPVRARCVPRDSYRLVSVRKTSARQLLQRRTEAAEWGAALTLARAYNLETDPIYQAQWARLSASAGWAAAPAHAAAAAASDNASIRALVRAALAPPAHMGRMLGREEHGDARARGETGGERLTCARAAELLDRLRSVRAALDACLAVAPPTGAEAAALLQYAQGRCARALRAARAEAPLASAGGVMAVAGADRGAEEAAAEAAGGSQRLSSSELAAYARRLRRAARMLATYQRLLLARAARAEREQRADGLGGAGARASGGQRGEEEEADEEEEGEDEVEGVGEGAPPSAAAIAAAERSFSASAFLALCAAPLPQLLLHAARSGMAVELRVLWECHARRDLSAELRLQVLAALPCTTSPSALRPLLPRLLPSALPSPPARAGAADGGGVAGGAAARAGTADAGSGADSAGEPAIDETADDDATAGGAEQPRGAPGRWRALPAGGSVCAHVREACAWACARARSVEGSTGLVSHALATLDLVLCDLAHPAGPGEEAAARGAAAAAELDEAMRAEGDAREAEGARAALREAQRLRCSLHELSVLVYAGGAGMAAAAAAAAASAGAAGSMAAFGWRLEAYEGLALDGRLAALVQACGCKEQLRYLLAHVLPPLLRADADAHPPRGVRPSAAHVASLARAFAPAPGAAPAAVCAALERVGWLLQLSTPAQHTAAARRGGGLAAVALAARAGLLPAAPSLPAPPASADPPPAAALLPDMCDVLRIALCAAYSPARVDAASLAQLSALYELMPTREACAALRARARADAAGEVGARARAEEEEEAAAAEEQALHECVDALDGHLSVQEMLLGRGLALPCPALLGVSLPSSLLQLGAARGAADAAQPVPAELAGGAAEAVRAPAALDGRVLVEIDTALSRGGGCLAPQSLEALLQQMVTAAARADAGAHVRGEPPFDWAELLDEMATVRERLGGRGQAAVPLRNLLRLWARGALLAGRCDLVLAFVLRQGAALRGSWRSGEVEPLREDDDEEEGGGGDDDGEHGEARAALAHAAACCRLSASDVRQLVLAAVCEWLAAAPSLDHPAVGRAAACLAAFEPVLSPAGAEPRGPRAAAELEALGEERQLVRACESFSHLLDLRPSGAQHAAGGGSFHLLPLQLKLARTVDERAALLLAACDAVGAPHERADCVVALIRLLRLPKAQACAVRERVCRSALRFGDVHAAAAEALWLAAEGHPAIWDACEVLAGTAALASPAAAERRSALLRHSLAHAPARALGALLAKVSQQQAAARRARARASPARGLGGPSAAAAAEAPWADGARTEEEEAAWCEPGGVGACTLARALASILGQPDAPAVEETPRKPRPGGAHAGPSERAAAGAGDAAAMGAVEAAIGQARAQLSTLAEEADAAAAAGDMRALASAEAGFSRAAHAAFSAASLAALAQLSLARSLAPQPAESRGAGGRNGAPANTVTLSSARALAQNGDLDAAAALPAAQLSALVSSLVADSTYVPATALAAAHFAREMDTVRAALARAERVRASSGVRPERVRLCRFALSAEYRAQLAAELASSASAPALREALRLVREERSAGAGAGAAGGFGCAGGAADGGGMVSQPQQRTTSAAAVAALDGGGGPLTEWGLRFAHLRATMLAAAEAEVTAGGAAASQLRELDWDEEEGKAHLLGSARALWSGLANQVLPLLPPTAHLAHERCLRLLADCARSWPPPADARDHARAAAAAAAACAALEAMAAWHAALRTRAPRCAASHVVALALGATGAHHDDAADLAAASADGEFGWVPEVALIAAGAPPSTPLPAAARAARGAAAACADGSSNTPLDMTEGAHSSAAFDATALARAVVSPLLATMGAAAAELRSALPPANMLRVRSQAYALPATESEEEHPAAAARARPALLAGPSLLQLGVTEAALSDALHESAVVRAVVALAQAHARSRSRAERKELRGGAGGADEGGEDVSAGADEDESTTKTVQLARALGLWACTRADEDPPRRAVGEGEAFEMAANALLRHVRGLESAHAEGGEAPLRPAEAARASLPPSLAPACELPAELSAAIGLLQEVAHAAPAGCRLTHSAEASALACDETLPLLLRVRALRALLSGAPACAASAALERASAERAGAEACEAAHAAALLCALELLLLLPAEWQQADAPWRPRGDSLRALALDLAAEQPARLRLAQLAAAVGTRAHAASLAHVLTTWPGLAPGAARAAEACVLPLLGSCAACGAIDVAVGVALSAASRRAAAGMSTAAGPAGAGAGGARLQQAHEARHEVEASIRALWAAQRPPRLAADAPTWTAASARGAAVTIALALLEPKQAAAEFAGQLLLPSDGGETALPSGAVTFDAPLARLLASADTAVPSPIIARLARSAHWPALGAALAELGPHAPAVRAAVHALVRTAQPVLAGELLLSAYSVPSALRGSAAGLSLLRAYLG